MFNMDSDAIVRNYHPSDFKQIKRIHENNELGFELPDPGTFFSHKVIEVNGKIHASAALKLTAETYLWLDRSTWTDADGKWAAVKVLNSEVTATTQLAGIGSMMLCLPPGFDRFGKRLKDIGFDPIREGWKVYSKEL
jgi:hypothetical protein